MVMTASQAVDPPDGLSQSCPGLRLDGFGLDCSNLSSLISLYQPGKTNIVADALSNSRPQVQVQSKEQDQDPAARIGQRSS